MTLTRFTASFFGCGFLPWAPGSWGSLAALPLGWLIVASAGKLWLFTAAVAVFILGCLVADRAARSTAAPDPGWIVIDEVVGQWLTLLLLPLTPLAYGIGFVLFRLFDIWKPWPIRWVERRYDGGFGIMIDDVLAALYAMILILVGRVALGR